MQTYSITQIKADAAALGHGTTLNNVQNFDGLVLRAARQVASDIDLKETVVKTSFKVYKDIFDYPLPDDIKGNKIIDLYPTNKDFNVKVYGQKYNQTFNRNSTNTAPNNELSFKYDTYNRSLSINAKKLPEPIIIDSAIKSSTYTGTVTNLITDTVNYKKNGASVRFNASTGQYVQKVLTIPLNLSSHYNLSNIFFDVDLSGNVTSLNFQLQTNNLNYYGWTIVTDSLGLPLTAGWHKVKLSWDTVTIVGTPSNSVINTIKLTYTSPSPVVSNINNFQSILGVQYNLSYYSERMFRNNLTGVFESAPSSDSSFINASNEGYNMFLNQIAMYIVQQVQGESMTSDMNFFMGEYKRCMDKQKMEYKSQIQKPQEYYYQPYPRQY